MAVAGKLASIEQRMNATHPPSAVSARTRQAALKALALLAAGWMGACGGRSELELGEPIPISASYKEIVGCSPPGWVPSGRAYIGGLEVGSRKAKSEGEDRPGMVVLPAPCADGHGLLPPVFVEVPGFYLDQDEASFACVNACVAAGACDGELQTNLDERSPAVATEALAEQVCTFRGGRVPTYPEMARAGQDNLLSMGSIELFRRYIHCLDNANRLVDPSWEGEACQQMLYRSPYLVVESEEEWRARLASAPTDDVGPFGHRDLFGAQIELTSTHTNFDDLNGGGFEQKYCMESVVEDQDFGSRRVAIYAPAFALSRGERSFRDFQETFGWNLSPLPVSTAGGQPYAIGFRCAFDAQELDEESP